MHQDLERLLVLQRLDSAAHAARNTIDDAPSKEKAFEARLAVVGVELDAPAAALEHGAAVAGLLGNASERQRLAAGARSFVEDNFSSRSVARVFEEICASTCR